MKFNIHYNTYRQQYCILSEDKTKYLTVGETSGEPEINPISYKAYKGWWTKKREAKDFLNEYESMQEKNNKFPLLSVKEQIELGRSLVGKCIKSAINPSVSGVIDEFKTIFDADEVCNDPDNKPRQDAQAMIDIQGVAFVLWGRWGDGGVIAKTVGISGMEVIEPEPWETVIINGYTAEKTAIGYKFGGAEISYLILTRARDLLLLSYCDLSSNRKIKSIKIGAGNFSLDDLQKLV